MTIGITPSFMQGEGGRGLEPPGIGPCAQPELIDRHLEQLLAGFIDLAIFLDVPVGHLRIAVDLHPLEPLELDPPGPVDPVLDLL